MKKVKDMLDLHIKSLKPLSGANCIYLSKGMYERLNLEMGYMVVNYCGLTIVEI